MSRLAIIEARRRDLLREIHATRSATRMACARARDGLAPLGLGFAAWQVVSGRGWMRAVALVPAAFVLLRRFLRGRRPDPQRRR